MSWKGTIRAIQAAERRAEREAQRRYRELQRQAKQQAKLSALEQARLEVETYENRIDLLLSIHKEQGEVWDWNQVRDTPPPLEPARTYRWQTDAENRRASYVPGLLDKLFGKVKKQLAAFEAELQAAQVRDEQEFQASWAQYQRDYVEWEGEKNLALSVLAGELESYGRVLRELLPFAELSELGSSISFSIHSPKVLAATVKVSSVQTIPSDIKTLTASGKVSKKPMPKSRAHEIYQDYVSGCILRVARETFGLLPIDTLIVTALSDVFDSRTGRTSEQPILSVVLPRQTLNQLNFNLLDPSDAMENFVHRGDFKASRKMGAFAPVQPIIFEELESPRTVSTDATSQSSSATTKNTPVKSNPAAAPSLISPVFSCGDASATQSAPRNGNDQNPTLESANQLTEKWTDAASRKELEFGFLRMTVNELAALLGFTRKDNFTLAESKALAIGAENLGFCLEPDPSHGAGNFWGDREIGIRPTPHGQESRPSENFLGAAALQQLCFLVAAADGSVDTKETDEFRKFIEGHFRFSWDERQRLLFMERLFSRNISSAKITLARAVKRVPKEKHLVIGQFLVNVAAADGVITPEEHKALNQIFGALGLNSGLLSTLIQNLALSGNEVVIQNGGSRAVGEAINQPDTSRNSGGLKLDMAKVAAISAETSEVIGILTKAMAEDDSAPPPAQPKLATARRAPPMDGSSTTLVAAAAGVLSKVFVGLDPKWHSIVQQLATKESWNRAEFESLARQHQLMPLSVFDSINEWSDEALGDFILEGEDPITVHRTLLKTSNE